MIETSGSSSSRRDKTLREATHILINQEADAKLNDPSWSRGKIGEEDVSNGERLVLQRIELRDLDEPSQRRQGDIN